MELCESSIRVSIKWDRVLLAQIFAVVLPKESRILCPFAHNQHNTMSDTTPQPEDGFYALVTGANRYVQTFDIVVLPIDTFIQAV